MGCYIGEWRVNGESFFVKSQALLRATELGAEVSYHYYDEIYASVDVTGLGRIPLGMLYKQRALQLRESYDYLILNYSGGADSRNILNTFLANNIKLDCVFVKWPLRIVGKNIYPITNNTDHRNFLCEWDLVIKPDLDMLRSKHPEIRIEVEDWTHDLGQSSFVDRMFDGLQQFTYMTNMVRVPSCSRIEREMADQGKKVAAIHGIDKPVFGMLPDGRCYMRFLDTATTVCPPRPHNPNGTEYFYWSPDMPNIPFEQCFAVMRWCRTNPRSKHLFDAFEGNDHLLSLTGHERAERFNKQQHIIKWLIYPNYDPTIFQAEKPFRGEDGFLGNTKDYYFETHAEIEPYKKIWQYHWQSWLGQIDGRFYTENGFFKALKSRAFYVGRL